MNKKKEMIYRCEHCSKPYFNGTACKDHESKCYRDSKHKTCMTCIDSNFGECMDESLKSSDGENVSKTRHNGGVFMVNCKKWKELEL